MAKPHAQPFDMNPASAPQGALAGMQDYSMSEFWHSLEAVPFTNDLLLMFNVNS